MKVRGQRSEEQPNESLILAERLKQAAQLIMPSPQEVAQRVNEFMKGIFEPGVASTGKFPPSRCYHCGQSIQKGGADHPNALQPSRVLPTVCRLPRPGERDGITGASRSWMLETDASLPPPERFIFRITRPGKIRGAVFYNVDKLLMYLRKAATDVA